MEKFENNLLVPPVCIKRELSSALNSIVLWPTKKKSMPYNRSLSTTLSHASRPISRGDSPVVTPCSESRSRPNSKARKRCSPTEYRPPNACAEYDETFAKMVYDSHRIRAHGKTRSLESAEFLFVTDSVEARNAPFQSFIFSHFSLV